MFSTGLKALDAHFHADILMSQVPGFVPAYQRLGLGGISWSYAHAIDTWRDYPGYWDHLAGVCADLTGRGLPCAYLVGIHPRCIPKDLSADTALPAELEQAMVRHLNQPGCRGLGELGLETGCALEGAVLNRQLDLACRHLPQGKKIGLHTPRQNKLDITRLIIRTLSSYPALKDAFLLDHLDASTLPLARDAGYMLGMTLQPGKSGIDEVQAMLDREPRIEDRLIVNSDGAKDLSQPFLDGVRQGLPESNRAWHKVFLANAREFWGVPISAA